MLPTGNEARRKSTRLAMRDQRQARYAKARGPVKVAPPRVSRASVAPSARSSSASRPSVLRGQVAK